MAEYVYVGEVSQIQPGQVKVVEIGDKRIALCRVEDEFYAIDDRCTHDGGPLEQGELEEYSIECPRHGARFDVRTGRVLALPAVLPLTTYPVRLEGTAIKVAVD